MQLVQSFQNCFKIPDLRRRILFTVGILVVYRIGGQITVPGVELAVLKEFFENTGNTLFGLYDMFVGGAFTRGTIFALGIMPYISASIILQLLGAVIPYFQKLQREGEEGRKKSPSTHAMVQSFWQRLSPTASVFSLPASRPRTRVSRRLPIRALALRWRPC